MAITLVFKVTTFLIIVSASFCNDKNVQIAELSIKLLTRLLQKVGQSIMQINPDALQILTQSMMALIRGKRQNLRNNALDICMFIYGQIGSENYLSLMNYALPP